MTEDEMRAALLGNPTLAQVAHVLDGYGITLVNMPDPVDGSPLPSIDWRQAIVLVNRVWAAGLREATRG